MGITTVWFEVDIMLISITMASYLIASLTVKVAQRHIVIKLPIMIKISINAQKKG
ncbi:MAG: hypothetical protein ACI9IT_000796 [Glaciecola sp.]|jgi:hypothetical protein